MAAAQTVGLEIRLENGDMAGLSEKCMIRVGKRLFIKLEGDAPHEDENRAHVVTPKRNSPHGV